MLADSGNKATNQAALVAEVPGRGDGAEPAGDTTPVRVATTGVFEFDCPAATFELGDLMGVDTGRRVAPC